MATSTAERPKLIPELQAVFDAIRYMDEHKKPPETTGDAGRYKQHIEALIEELRTEGYEAYQSERARFFNDDKYASAMFATYGTPGPEQKEDDQDVRTRIGKSGKRVFIRSTEDDVDQFPDLEFMISGILPTDAVSLFFGPSGTGKTFNALHCAQCVARGIPWHGRRVKQGNVLYVYAEGKLGLKPRLQAWRKHHEEEKTDKVTYIGVPVQLKGDRQTLLDTLEDMIATDEKPKLMIIDTFSNCANGVDQNLQKEVHEVLTICHEIKDKYGVHVMLVHHTNKAGDFNGTQGFRNHVDTMIELVPDEKASDVLWMKCEKQRDGADKFSPIKLSLKIIELGLNVETMESLSSCVVVESDTLTSKEAQAETEALEQVNMLNVLSLYGELSTSQWKKHSLTYEVSSRAFDKHSKTLFTEGKVKQRTKGKNGTAIYWSIPCKGNATQEELEPDTPYTPQTDDVTELKSTLSPEERLKREAMIKQEFEARAASTRAYQEVNRQRKQQPSTPYTTANSNGV